MPFNIPVVEGHQRGTSVLLIASESSPSQGSLEKYIAWLQCELAVAKRAWEALTEKSWDADGPPDAGRLETT